MVIPLIIACVLVAWAALRVLGGERERRIRDLMHSLSHANPGDSSGNSDPSSSTSHHRGLVDSKVSR